MGHHLFPSFLQLHAIRKVFAYNGRAPKLSLGIRFSLVFPPNYKAQKRSFRFPNALTNQKLQRLHFSKLDSVHFFTTNYSLLFPFLQVRVLRSVQYGIFQGLITIREMVVNELEWAQKNLIRAITCIDRNTINCGADASATLPLFWESNQLCFLKHFS